LARKNVALEAEGIPTVGLVFDYFEGDFNSSAQAVGMKELPHVVAKDAYTGLPVELVRADVTTHIDEIIASLTTPLEHVEPGTINEKIITQAGYPAPWGTVEAGPVDDGIIRFTGTDYADVYESFQQKFLDWGWGDGFPLIPPTNKRLMAMLQGTSHAPDEEMTTNFYPARGIATVELIAIQAVMAGARPEYFPVILAAVQAIINSGQRFILTAQTTSPTAPFFWVNGPIIKELGINASTGTLGPGAQSRANIAIGRTIRLVMMNIGGAYLGIKDMDTIGAADKFSLVAAENEEDLKALDWKPYHVNQGFDKNESTITMMPTTDRGHVMGMNTDSAEALLQSFALDMASVGGPEWMSGIGRGGIVLLSGDDARNMVNQGFKTKVDIRNYIASHVRVQRELFIRFFTPQASSYGQLDEMLAAYPEGEDIIGIDPELITVLRVGAFEGKNDFYRGSGAHTVSIADWR